MVLEESWNISKNDLLVLAFLQDERWDSLTALVLHFRRSDECNQRSVSSNVIIILINNLLMLRIMSIQSSIDENSEVSNYEDEKILKGCTRSDTEPGRLEIMPQNDRKHTCDCGGKGGEACSCGSENLGESMNSNHFIYAIGRLQPRFPTPGVEKEYHQAIGRIETRGQTDYEAMRTALSQKQNRYLVRQMCWVLSIEGIETYIVKPHDPADFDLLVESLRVPPRGTDIDVVIGRRGPIATPEMCNGLTLPIVVFEQIYSFDVEALMKALPKAEKTRGKEYGSKSEELLYRIMQMADNTGATDEHRCLNYLAVRYPAYYEKTVEMHENDCSLSSIEVRPSRLSGTRKILDCIFSFTNRKTDVADKWFCRVDLSEMFPYLVTRMSPYYDR